MLRTRSVGTRMRPTVPSAPSIFTLRANFSRTASSLLLATRRTKNCMRNVSLNGPVYACVSIDAAPGRRIEVRSAKETVEQVTNSRHVERLDPQHLDGPEERLEGLVDHPQQGGDHQHEADHHLGRTDQLLAAGPVDLLHLAV